MLNRHDIEDMMPETMKTKFDEDGLPLATNHEGWNVEGFEGIYGWNVINSQPFQSKYAAKVYMEYYTTNYPDREFRVYEALTIQ